MCPQVGRLWTSLADYYIRQAMYEKARDIYEEGLSTVITVRDFSLIFDTLTAVRLRSVPQTLTPVRYISWMGSTLPAMPLFPPECGGAPNPYLDCTGKVFVGLSGPYQSLRDETEASANF